MITLRSVNPPSLFLVLDYEIITVNFSGISRYYTFTLHPHKGESNTIKVDRDRIRDKEEQHSCSNTVHTSWIQSVSHQSIC